MSLHDKIQSKKAVVGIIGLGQIGLAILDAFGKKGFSLVGYDIDPKRVDKIKAEKDFPNHITPKDLQSLSTSGHLALSSDPTILKQADVLIISVPTSLDAHFEPDLHNIQEATKTISSILCREKPRLIIMQSTSYPGTTQEMILPILQSTSLQVGRDFFLACVPEVLDIGNQEFTFASTPKMIGAVTESCYELAESLYKHITTRLFKCSRPAVCESAKMLQNSYRLVNLSFINEMKMIFQKMDLDIWEIIEAASTKPFGFTPFFPGPGIGGNCIPVDPVYLAWKAKTSDGHATLIETALNINAAIPHYVVGKITEGLNRREIRIKGAKILVIGVAYKKDTKDISESPALPILDLLRKKNAIVSYHDPLISEIHPLTHFPDLSMKSTSFEYSKLMDYDCVVIITDHTFYDWNEIVKNSQLIVDTRNVTTNINGSKATIIKA